MKQSIGCAALIGACVLFAAAVPGIASAESVTTPTAAHRYAVGVGTETYEGRTLHFTFSAQRYGTQPPAGYVALNGVNAPPLFTGGNGRIQGAVQCLAVSGNIANLVFVVQRSSAPAYTVGERIAVFTQDFGNPNRPSNPDRFGFGPSSLFVNQICSGNAFGGEPGVVTQGNVVVHDGRTAPPA